MKKYYTYILLFAFLFFSCDLDSSKIKPERKYTAERMWRSEVFGYINFNSPPLVLYPYCYFYADALGSVVKINLETGKVRWESEKFDGKYQQPQKIGGYIYQPSINGTITVLDDLSGNIAATVELAGYSMDYRRYAVVSGDYLLWSNPYASTKGLTRLDTTKIDFSKVPFETQTVAPELIWTDGKTGINAQILTEDGIVYFFNRSNVLIAVDARTGDILWEQEVPEIISIFSDFPIALHGEKILVIAENITGYNKLTGDFIFEIIGLGTENTSSFLRYTLHNNLLFYTSSSGGLINAVDIDTGKKVWSNDIESHCNDYSCEHWKYNYGRHYYSSPFHVYGNSLFIMSDNGLRVYNAANGTFIGVDKTFNLLKDFNGLFSVLHNDIIVFFCDSPIYPASCYLIAIRCK